MNLLKVLVLALGGLGATVACASTLQNDLGHGFLEIVRGTSSYDVFIGHETRLSHASHRLGRVDWYSIAPSGAYVVFARGHKVWLYLAVTHRSQLVTDEWFYFTPDVAWQEEQSRVELEYFDLFDRVSQRKTIDLKPETDR